MVDIVRKKQFIYRVGQFFKVLLSHPDETQLNKISQILEPDQFGLFKQLQNSEQVHAIHVMELIEQEGYPDKDFLKAALLHDIGKIVHPLKLWERVISVICRWINPDCLDDLEEADIRGWKRGLVITKKHPEWGADLISNSNASPELVEIIRKHHEGEMEANEPKYQSFLLLFRSIDDNN